MNRVRRIGILFLFSSLITACSSTVPKPSEQLGAFPTIKAKSLAGEEVQLPQKFAGAPVVLLVGYDMNTQFDIDRWALGLMQLNTKVKLYELPTIRGLVPSIISERIDNGMRKGIPSEDWPSVITIYEESDKLISLTGNENPRNARVFLLDSKGDIRFFHDRGFSPAKAMELKTLLDLIS